MLLLLTFAPVFAEKPSDALVAETVGGRMNAVIREQIVNYDDTALNELADILLAEMKKRHLISEGTTIVPYPSVTITMENGKEIHLELYPDIAPNTVANFVKLVQSGFYDGVIFHRVIPGFMIQGGDPQGSGQGGPGFTIEGEMLANGHCNMLSHTRGVISMARRGSGAGGNNQGFNTAGSQFFIMDEDYPSLDGMYAAFGRVTDEDSMSVVKEIANTETDSNDKPLIEQRIKTIEVDTHGYVYSVVRIYNE